MKETETSMMKTMETKTQCTMKQRGTGLLSLVFGNSKINEKNHSLLCFSLYLFDHRLSFFVKIYLSNTLQYIKGSKVKFSHQHLLN